MDAEPNIFNLTGIEVSLEEFDWEWEKKNRDMIEMQFNRTVAENPKIWNGPIFLSYDITLDNGVLSAKVFETSFASFLSHRDLGWPDKNVRILFGSAIIQSCDGALLFGRMAHHTSNPSKTIPPSGAIGPEDIKKNRVNLRNTVLRELLEEFGIVEECCNNTGVAFVDHSVCVFGHFQRRESATHLHKKIDKFLSRDPNSEFSSVHTISELSDIEGLETLKYARVISEHFLKN